MDGSERTAFYAEDVLNATLILGARVKIDGGDLVK
jgi:hypothetical protein